MITENSRNAEDKLCVSKDNAMEKNSLVPIAMVTKKGLGVSTSIVNKRGEIKGIDVQYLQNTKNKKLIEMGFPSHIDEKQISNYRKRKIEVPYPMRYPNSMPYSVPYKRLNY